MFKDCYEERVIDYNGYLSHIVDAPPVGGLHLYNGKITVHTDAGEEEDAAVHVNKIAK